MRKQLNQLNQLKEQLYDIQERVRKLEEGLNALDFYDSLPVLTVPEPIPEQSHGPVRKRTTKELREAIGQLLLDGEERSIAQVARELGEAYTRVHYILRHKG